MRVSDIDIDVINTAHIWDKKKKEFQDKFKRENSDLEIESGKKVKEIPPAAA